MYKRGNIVHAKKSEKQHKNKIFSKHILNRVYEEYGGKVRKKVKNKLVICCHKTILI